MTIKDICTIASTITGREDMYRHITQLENGNIQTEKDVEILYRLANLVINELACSFIPMITVEEQVGKNGKVYYTSLKNRPLEILKAYDKQGVEVDFKVTGEYVYVGQTPIDIEYSYFPEEYGPDEQIGFKESDVSTTTLAHGVAAEFAIAKGCFKDAVMWHERYAEGINRLLKPKNTMVKRRNFS